MKEPRNLTNTEGVVYRPDRRRHLCIFLHDLDAKEISNGRRFVTTLTRVERSSHLRHINTKE